MDGLDILQSRWVGSNIVCAKAVQNGAGFLLVSIGLDNDDAAPRIKLSLVILRILAWQPLLDKSVLKRPVFASRQFGFKGREQTALSGAPYLVTAKAGMAQFVNRLLGQGMISKDAHDERTFRCFHKCSPYKRKATRRSRSKTPAA